MKAEISVLRLAIEEAKEQSEREANEENLVIVFFKKNIFIRRYFLRKIVSRSSPA